MSSETAQYLAGGHIQEAAQSDGTNVKVTFKRRNSSPQVDVVALDDGEIAVLPSANPHVVGLAL